MSTAGHDRSWPFMILYMIKSYTYFHFLDNYTVNLSMTLNCKRRKVY